MPALQPEFALERCPHCQIDHPQLLERARLETADYANHNPRRWIVYVCRSCGGVVVAGAQNYGHDATEWYPKGPSVDEDLPDRAKRYLTQALDSLHAPAGAVMLAASAVDAMLKAKNYRDGSLYSRIDRAAEEHVITADMARWAHEVRLDANSQRHADTDADLPNAADARRSVDFAVALGQFLFVLPAKVRRGLNATPNS